MRGTDDALVFTQLIDEFFVCLYNELRAAAHMIEFSQVSVFSADLRSKSSPFNPIFEYISMMFIEL